jgi:hypothetical protein
MVIIHKRNEPNLTTDLEGRNFCFETHALFCWKDLLSKYGDIMFFLSKYGEFGVFFPSKTSFLPFILDFFCCHGVKFCNKTKYWMRVFVGLGSLLVGSITTNLVELLPITTSVGMIYNSVGQILSRMINNKEFFF